MLTTTPSREKPHVEKELTPWGDRAKWHGQNTQYIRVSFRFVNIVEQFYRLNFCRARIERVAQRAGIPRKIAICAHFPRFGLFARHEQGRRRRNDFSPYHFRRLHAPHRAKGT